MMSDLRQSLRVLVKQPLFSGIAMITLALGIGANTTIFSVVDALLFRRPPFPSPEELVRVWDHSQQTAVGPLSFGETRELKQQLETADSVTAFAGWANTLVLPGQPAEQLHSINVSGDFFRTFGVQPAIGRAFSDDEQVPGKNKVAILSHALWQSRFSARPDIVGQVIRLNSEPVTVVGVMPVNFEYRMLWGKVDLWRPVSLPQKFIEDRDFRVFQVVARLKPAISAGQLAPSLNALSDRLARDFPKSNSGHGFRALPLRESVLDQTGRRGTWLLMGLAGFVLLIACANVANLQIARGTASARELAIRSAFGAPRHRLIRLQLTESLLVAAGGGILSVAVSAWTTRLLQTNILSQNDEVLHLQMDARVLFITGLLSLASGVVFGLMPAWFSSGVNVMNALRLQSRGATADRGTQLIRKGLIVAEIALTIVLLAGADIMWRGLSRSSAAETNWDAQRIATAAVYIPEGNQYEQPDKVREFHRKLELQLAQLPQVKDAALATGLPIGFYSTVRGFEVDGQTSLHASEQPTTGVTMVSGSYFSLLNIRLLAGSFFNADVRSDTPPLVIVNESLARHFWPGESAVGKRIATRSGDSRIYREIIGVVQDVPLTGNFADTATRFQIYQPLIQEPWNYVVMMVRGEQTAPPASQLKSALSQVDADIALTDALTMEQALDRWQHNFILGGRILQIFAVLALVLATVGLFGVVSNTVAHRTTEFGIRLALGAPRKHILLLVFNGGLRLAAVGILLGLVGAFQLGKLLSSIMPTLGSSHWGTLLATALLLVVVTLSACTLPAIKAVSSSNPLDALRGE